MYPGVPLININCCGQIMSCLCFENVLDKELKSVIFNQMQQVPSTAWYHFGLMRLETFKRRQTILSSVIKKSSQNDFGLSKIETLALCLLHSLGWPCFAFHSHWRSQKSTQYPCQTLWQINNYVTVLSVLLSLLIIPKCQVSQKQTLAQHLTRISAVFISSCRGHHINHFAM